MENVANSGKTLLKGTFILSLAAMITKVLSAVYRIPFQNIVGDIGFYIYQQVYPFYGISLSLATYGFPVIISKLYADRISRNLSGKCILFPAFVAIFPFCIIVFSLIFFGAPYMAKKMGDHELAPLIQVSSFSFLLIPFISILRGFFQGMGDMKPTAISQVGEQTVRVVMILVISIIFIVNGSSLYLVGKGAVLASIIGSIFCLVILLYYYFFRKKEVEVQNIQGKINFFQMVKKIFVQGIVVCISGMTLIIFQLIDSFQIVPLLLAKGLDLEQAKEIKGIYDRGQPLLQIGLVLATSFSLSLVPMITMMRNKGIDKEVGKYIRLAFQVSFSIGASAAIGLFMIMEPLNSMLFTNSNGSDVLQLLSFTVLFLAINITISAVLQGMDNIMYPSFVVFIGAIGKIVLNMIFIGKFGIIGAAVASVASTIVMFLLLTVKLKKVIKERFLSNRYFLVLFRSLMLMIVFLFLWNEICEWLQMYVSATRLFFSLQALIAAGFGAVIMMVLLISGKIFTEDELLMFPFGHKLIRFLPKNEKGAV